MARIKVMKRSCRQGGRSDANPPTAFAEMSFLCGRLFSEAVRTCRSLPAQQDDDVDPAEDRHEDKEKEPAGLVDVVQAPDRRAEARKAQGHAYRQGEIRPESLGYHARAAGDHVAGNIEQVEIPVLGARSPSREPDTFPSDKFSLLAEIP